MTKKLLLLAAVFGGLMLSSAHAQEKTPITIATDGAYAPWAFTEAGGKQVGYEIDLANEICAKMQRKCDIVAQNFDGLIPALNAGKFELIMAAMSVTEERQKVVSFSDPYGMGVVSFVTKKDGALANLPAKGKLVFLDENPEQKALLVAEMAKSFDGKTIGVQGSTTNAALLQTLFGSIATIREYKSNEELELDLQAERVDAVLISATAGKVSLEKKGFENYAFAGPLLSTGKKDASIAAAFRKDEPELMKEYNEALASIAKSGKLKDLSLKWFGNDITPSAGFAAFE